MSKLGAAVTILVASHLFAPATLAQAPILERSATSSIKIGQDQYGVVFTTVSRRFGHTQLPAEHDSQVLILLEEFRAEWRPGVEGQQGVVKVDASLGLEPKKVWSIEQEGDAGQVFDYFYKVTKYGCCDSRPTDVYFNLRTGERTFFSTQRWLSRAIVPNTGMARYVAYHSSEGSLRPLPEKERRNDLAGVIQYGSYDKVMLRLAVRSKGDPLMEQIKFLYRGKISGDSDLMLWGVDGKKEKSSLSDFSIIVSYGRAGDIVLPVRNDEIDLGKATVPPRFSLEVLK